MTTTTTTKSCARIDVHGLSIRGDGPDANRDHFAIADLKKSMRVHQSNLALDDGSRVDGHVQGRVLLLAEAASSPRDGRGAATDELVSYFLNEMPWYHVADGHPEDVVMALQDALANARDDSARRLDRGDPRITLAFLTWPDLYVAHLGGVGCHLLRGDALHPIVEAAATAQREPPRGRRLGRLRRLGRRRVAAPRPRVEYQRLEPGDVLALLSSGLEGHHAPDDLRAILAASGDAEVVCDRLLAGRGERDRTALVARFVPSTRCGVPARARQPALRAMPRRPGARARSRHQRLRGTGGSQPLAG